ncbi:unnamed protein product, partial [Dovyalis caffra]
MDFSLGYPHIIENFVRSLFSCFISYPQSTPSDEIIHGDVLDCHLLELDPSRKVDLLLSEGENLMEGLVKVNR